MRCRWLPTVACAVAAALGAAPLQAQWITPPDSFYTGIEGGWSALISTKTSTKTATFSVPDRRESFEDGDWNYADHLLLGLRAGVNWGPWSLEEEGTYRHNKVFRFSDMPFSGAPTRPYDGQRNAYALMTNLIYNYAMPEIQLFNYVMPWGFHAGAGLGAVYVIDRLAVNSNLFGGSAFGPGVCCIHGSDWFFGYQGLAGVRFEITPNVLLDIDYRYIGTPNGLQFKNKGGGTPLTYHISGGYQTTDSFFSLIVRF